MAVCNETEQIIINNRIRKGITLLNAEFRGVFGSISIMTIIIFD